MTVTATLSETAADYYWFGSESVADNTYTATGSGQLTNIARDKGYTARAVGYSYNSFNATLSDCTYKNGVGTAAKTYIQQVKVTEYFHQGTEKNVKGGNTLTEVTPTSSYKLSAGQYLVTDVSGNYAFNGTETPVVLTRDNGSITNSNLPIWSVDKNQYWKIGDQYLRLGSMDFFGNKNAITYAEKDGGYTMKGSSRYLTFTESTQKFGRDQTRGTAMKFWTVTQVASSYKCEFTYKGLMNQACVAVEKTN